MRLAIVDGGRDLARIAAPSGIILANVDGGRDLTKIAAPS
jgi:hypothetical protein